VDRWTHTSVVLNDSWGLGADDILKTPLGKNPEFTLRPRYLRDSQGNRQVAHFTVEFSSGYLPDGWQGATFTPMGVDPVQGIAGLPEWDPVHKTGYRDKINAAAASLGNPRTERLEGVIPYLGAKGGVGYDTVRLFYVADAVTSSHSPHLVVLKTATLVDIPGNVRSRQDGSGQGPPRK
jgi:hypothetical protein